jgi:tol-pal system protein YbgF
MKKLLPIAALGFALALTAQSAIAQPDIDNDLQPLMDRVNRLERDMSAMERQVYRRGDDGAPVVRGQAGAGDEMNFEQIGDQLRAMTGRIEEIRHDVDSLRARMEKMSNDVDLRLQALEHPNGAPGMAMTGAPPDQQPALAPPPRNRNPPARQNSANPPPPPDEQTAAMAMPPDAGSLPNGSPQQQYDYAFGLLRDANYPAAERALKDFVRRYPTNRLSSNAQYWLGETYFVRRNFQAAAAAFAEGYQKYPKGPKAPEDLLKLGTALSQLGRKADACRSFAQLDRDFPVAPSNVKQKEAEEKRKARCS